MDIYEKSTYINQITLKQQFFGFKHDTTQPIQSYITGITDLATQLKGIGIKLNEEAIVDVLIFNLDKSWFVICASLTAAQFYLSIANITGMLLNEESWHRELSSKETA